jgi:hypothetical protein
MYVIFNGYLNSFRSGTSLHSFKLVIQENVDRHTTQPTKYKMSVETVVHRADLSQKCQHDVAAPHACPKISTSGGAHATGPENNRFDLIYGSITRSIKSN